MPLLAQGNNNPGRLDRRVSLHYSVATRDATGGQALTWVEAATVWAAKKTVSGGRLYAAEDKRGESIQLFRIRFRTDVQRFWRLVYGQQTFEIIDIDTGEAREQFLDITVRGIDQQATSELQGLLAEGPLSGDIQLEGE